MNRVEREKLTELLCETLAVAQGQDGVRKQIADVLRFMWSKGDLTITTRITSICPDRASSPASMAFAGPPFPVGPDKPGYLRKYVEPFVELQQLTLADFRLDEDFDGRYTLTHGNLRSCLVDKGELDPRPKGVIIGSTRSGTETTLTAADAGYFSEDQLRQLVAEHLNRTNGWDDATLQLVYEDGLKTWWNGELYSIKLNSNQ